MNLPKRLKLSLVMISDEISSDMENSVLHSNLLTIHSMFNAVSNITESYNTCLLGVVSTYREKHFRMPFYSEEWLQKYIEYDFFRLFRMTRITFEKLLNKISEVRMRYFPKTDHTGGRKEVSLEKSLLMTLWYVGKGETIVSISDRFNITESTTHSVISKCLAYIVKLIGAVIKWPNDHEKKFISDEFESIGGYPGTIGAIDGCHIAFKAPENQHDSYQNRKFFHSINLQGICTVNKMFTNIFAGFPGSANDARVFKNSTLYKSIEKFGSTRYFGSNDKYHIIGDSAYILLPWLMKPYEHKNLTRKQRHHNYILSKSRVAIEHTFGLLKGRWRILFYINVNSIEKAVTIITACCILHNFCLFNKDEFDVEEEINEENYSENYDIQYFKEDTQHEAKIKRDLICDHLFK